MTSLPTLLYIAALVVALVDEFLARGSDLIGWAVVLIAVGLLLGLRL